MKFWIWIVIFLLSIVTMTKFLKNSECKKFLAFFLLFLYFPFYWEMLYYSTSPYHYETSMEFFMFLFLLFSSLILCIRLLVFEVNIRWRIKMTLWWYLVTGGRNLMYLFHHHLYYCLSWFTLPLCLSHLKAVFLPL